MTDKREIITSRGIKIHFLLLAALSLACLTCHSTADKDSATTEKTLDSENWRQEAVKRARIMSRIKWIPVANTMPVNRGKGHFKKGQEYTGVPYSSVKIVGRCIGFDIYLKTFLAAAQNPRSVLYTENLSSKVMNAGPYYGKVCSSFTSYALGCGIPYISWLQAPRYRKGIKLVKPQSAQTAKIGDIIQTPSGHVEIVTDITKNADGKVTHVRIEESWPKTTKNTNYDENGFSKHLEKKNKLLYRITDLLAWRGKNKAESFLFPNYKEDSATPVINRVLLLDRGDWVPYLRGQVVRINIMDKDNQGVKKLIITRGNKIIQELKINKKKVVSRAFSICGDYTAYCIMKDGSLSQACEFSVCDLDLKLPDDNLSLGKPFEIKFSCDNMKIILVHMKLRSSKLMNYIIFVSDKDRAKGAVTIPETYTRDAGSLQVWLIGENRYGRLKKRQDAFIKK